jgi:hypothetical protein
MGPAGSARQTLPPTVASCEILEEPASAAQHWRSNGSADHSGGPRNAVSWRSVQVAAMDKPDPVTSSGGQPRPRTSTRVCKSGCGSENSQVPPASTAAPGPTASSERDVGRSTAVMVWRSTQYSTRSGLASQASNGSALLGTASASTVIAQVARSRANSS